MKHLKLIAGTESPDTPKKRISDTLRLTKQKNIPQCVCGSRSYIILHTGTLKQKVCAHCFVHEQRIVVMK